MDKLIANGRELGFEGKDLTDFVKQQQAIEREDRAHERQLKQAEIDKQLREKELDQELRQKQLDKDSELKQLELEARNRELERDKDKLEAEREERDAQRRHELDLKRLDLEDRSYHHTNDQIKAKAPKLPSFVDGKDDLDSYLQRFERFAMINKWDAGSWATSLSALLTGKALDVYSRLSDDDAMDYKQLKEALLKRYDLTEDGFRVKFRDSRPEKGESPEQFVVRLKSYLSRWVELSKTEKSYDELGDLFVKEQFINACDKDLAVYLRERAPTQLADLAKLADQYLIAHEQQFNKSTGKIKQSVEKDSSTYKCYNCLGYGHIAKECSSKVLDRRQSPSGKKCDICEGFGHDSKECPNNKKTGKFAQISAASLVFRLRDSNEFTKPQKERNEADHDSTDIMTCSSNVHVAGKLEVFNGRIGNNNVETLRDTGCTGVVVRKRFVKDEEMTGEYIGVSCIHGSCQQTPVANINIDTPFFKGQVKAQVLENPVCDLIIGNIPGVRSPGNPDPSWQEVCAVTACAKSKKEGMTNSTAVDKVKLFEMQKEDKSLHRFPNMNDVQRKGQNVQEWTKRYEPLQRDNYRDSGYERRRGWGSRGDPMLYRGGGRGTPRGAPKGLGNRPPRESQLTFEGDFDFEESNAQFDKEGVGKEFKEKGSISGKVVKGNKQGEEAGIEPEERDEIFYDKAKSFFDNISCETTRRAKGLSTWPNWREERKMNTETFGQTGLFRRSFRWRGNYGWRDGGLRGNFRGRGAGGAPRGGGGTQCGFPHARGSQGWVDYDYDYTAAGIGRKNDASKSEAMT